MFRAGLLLIIMGYAAIGICHAFMLTGRFGIMPAASQHNRMTYTNCCIHRVVPPDDEQ
jgi:hypothetical protein